jgi:lysophospholipase L1-like esterase
MRPLRYVALGDSLTEGVGDPVGNGWRGWAALLAGGLCEPSAEFTNLAVSGAQTRDVLETQLPAALALRPQVASVVVGVNDTLRSTYDIEKIAERLDRVYASFARQGTAVLTACLPDPGTMLGLPGVLGNPLARRQRAVNTVVHTLSERYGAVHLHAVDDDWISDGSMWSSDRLHPGERGHRQLALRFHAMLAKRGIATCCPSYCASPPRRCATVRRAPVAGSTCGRHGRCPWRWLRCRRRSRCSCRDIGRCRGVGRFRGLGRCRGVGRFRGLGRFRYRSSCRCRSSGPGRGRDPCRRG